MWFHRRKKRERFYALTKTPKIILKVDDLCKYSKSMVKFTEYCLKHDICFCLGIIGQSLENPSEQYIKWVKKLLATNMLELFNHGYLHACPSELCWRSYSEQKFYIEQTQNIVKEKLGVTLTTIGTPGNERDKNTLRAVESVKDIDTWLFGDEKYSKCMHKRTVYLEKPFPMPSLNHVIDGLMHIDNVDCVVLECHPQMWKDSEWKTFFKIMDFLKKNNAQFVLPHNC